MHNSIIILSLIFFYCFNLFSNEVGSVTGWKLPRYVSLKSNESNLRIGPSENYPIILQFNKKNYPLEIIDEHEIWRKVNDIEGNKGWIHKNLLKGDRYAIINPLNKDIDVKVYSKPNGNLIGLIGRKNIVEIDVCLIDWCKIYYQEYKGWLSKDHLWGVYNNEKINIPIYQKIVNIIWKINFYKKDK